VGTIRQHEGVRAGSQTTIEIDFRYQGARCRERLALQPTPANLKRAAQHRAAVLDAIANGTFDYPTTFPNSPNAARFAARAGDVLLTENFLETWINQKSSSLKSSTALDYRKIIFSQLAPAFGKIPLTSIKRTDIKAWATTLTAGNKRIGNVLSVFRAALQTAFEDELIEANPLAGWTYRKATPATDTDDVDPFTLAEQAAILATLTGQQRNLIQFAFWTGLRQSEIVAIEWGDVDYLRGIIKISRAITQAGNGIAETTKTRAGLREIKLLRPALDALSAQKQFTFLHGAEIFQNPRTNERWRGDQPIRKFWTTALKRAGVRYRRPYQTRHTYASMMLSAGEHPMWVAAQMGHRDWGMIRNVYGKFMPDAQPQAGGLAVQTFWGEQPQAGKKQIAQ